MTPLSVEFEVRGMPGPQGSKRHVGHGVMIESSKKVAPWREAVKYAALEVRQKLKAAGARNVCEGPVEVSLTFTLPKPKSAPKRTRTYPSKKPDLDKLIRSTFDALTQVGLIEDDARVIGTHAWKVFPGEGEHSLDTPGAWIQVAEIGGDRG